MMDSLITVVIVKRVVINAVNVLLTQIIVQSAPTWQREMLCQIVNVKLNTTITQNQFVYHVLINATDVHSGILNAMCVVQLQEIYPKTVFVILDIMMTAKMLHVYYVDICVETVKLLQINV